MATTDGSCFEVNQVSEISAQWHRNWVSSADKSWTALGLARLVAFKTHKDKQILDWIEAKSLLCSHYMHYAYSDYPEALRFPAHQISWVNE